MSLPIVERDPWLKPVESVINQRYADYLNTKQYICSQYGSLKQYATAHHELGFVYDKEQKGWFFRDWLPNSEQVFLTGDFNGWNMCRNPLSRKENGIWEVFLSDNEWQYQLVHGSRVKLYIKSQDGWNERIPAYIRFTSEDEKHNFSGVFWNPSQPFRWEDAGFSVKNIGELLIYECHVGMAQEKEAVGTFLEFVKNNIPRIKDLGYNTIQIMALAEHPYYGSFGYHVSNFFSPSSRFGTPEELKALVNEAHKAGIAVIMDIVHSHFVENVREGLNRLDGSDDLYCHAGERGNHPHWKSKLFNYGKNEVRRFLLSNIRYWMEEFHLDGFRFDGVTSMIYTHHGYVDDFGTYENYFGKEIDRDALIYLALANDLIHELNPDAVTIAEEVSGMPGVAVPTSDGGFGFDYRMGMAVPDYWIKILKDQTDEQWNLSEMWNMLTDRLWDIKTVTYCESHDQALVGDQTIAFRLVGTAMYDKMGIHDQSLIVDRGIALHKMIRLITMSLGGQAYLNFMGNEFGHPEWIDFPRQGNNFSYAHARRIWSLVDNPELKYRFLNNFDKACIQLLKEYHILNRGFAQQLWLDENNKTIIFSHGDLIFIFNWHGTASVADYKFVVPQAGKYKIVLNSDSKHFGGFGRIDEQTEFFTQPNNNQHLLSIYNTSRTALVLEKVD
ncbi:alpha amylase C-terminal domain-containing protein [Bacteroidales bacterium OttesenSCG-928-C19]|nr:alpha amylase C-terminal domain-containing protein [Bacteroidales bacterium OttesenSCG-928-C19]